jgi:uncharacterized coiled-coil protein SlyX
MKTIFAKYNSERVPKYQIVTKIVEDKDQKRYALKEPMCEEAKEHIETIYQNYKLLKSVYDINLVKPTKVKSGVQFELAEGRSLENILLTAISQNDDQKFQKYIDKFLAFVDGMVYKRDVVFKPSQEFEDVFGSWDIDEPQDIIKVANIDMIFSNIFIDERDEFRLIDYEWVFDFEVPKSYVVWRSLAIFSIYHTVNIAKYYNQIIQVDNDFFLEKDIRFGDFVHGKVKQYFLTPKVGKDIYFIDLEKKESTVSLDYFIQLFIEDKDGISEENSLKLAIKQTNDIQRFVFDLKDKNDIKSLRVDPLNDYVILKLNSIQIDGKDYKQEIFSNAIYKDDTLFYFNTNDPQIYLNIEKFDGIDEISFELKYLHTGEDALTQVSNILYKILETKEQDIDELNGKLQTKEQDIDELNDKLQTKEQDIDEKSLDIAIIKQRLKIYHPDISHKILEDLQ